MFDNFDETYMLNESILDDISADEYSGKSADKLVRSEKQITTPDDLIQEFQFIFRMSFTAFNFTQYQKEKATFKKFLEHMDDFLNNQRLIKRHILLKPILLRWNNERFNDRSVPGEHRDYFLWTEEHQSKLCHMPPKSAASYRLYIFFGMDLSKQHTAKQVIRFVYQMSQILKSYIPTAYCTYSLYRTPLCPYNVTGGLEGGQDEQIHTNARYVKEIYTRNTENRKADDKFNETNFAPFKRFLCFLSPDNKGEILKELARTMADYDSHQLNLIEVTHWDLLKKLSFSPRMKSRKIPQNAVMKRAFTSFALDSSTFDKCPSLYFGCKMIYDRNVNAMSSMFTNIPEQFDRGLNDKRRVAILEYFKEQPVKLTTYDFRYVQEEQVVTFCGYIGILNNDEETFELTVGLGSEVVTDEEIDNFSNQLSLLFGSQVSPKDIANAILKAKNS